MDEYIVAIDQSTSASKVFLVNRQGGIVTRCAKKHAQFFPRSGYVEQDAEEIWQNVRTGIEAVTRDCAPEELRAIAISNQRETTVIWERATGIPLGNAIVWQDVRAGALCRDLLPSANEVLAKTGLRLSAYYPAAKAAFVLREHPEWQKRAEAGEICIGTMDSYLIFRLTNGAVFRTDVSNASRTELCDIHTLQWDAGLLSLFGIPRTCLPDITPSDGDFGRTETGVPITGVMGDSHASLFGQGCLCAGMAKATYGTGSSVMMNVGDTCVSSSNGLSASVGFGFRGKICYVLEGNVTSSGDTLCWLRDEARLIDDVADAESIAASVRSTEGAYFIPAFSGLGAPYFDADARAVLAGIHRGTTRAHIIRAALESIAYQDAEIVAAMERDTGKPLSELRVDGGVTCNALLMQFQSNLLGCPVRCAAQSELSALGAACMAGMRVGVFGDEIFSTQRGGKTYLPGMGREERESLLTGWRKTVKQCRQ